jgi:hypothetical protein
VQFRVITDPSKESEEKKAGIQGRINSFDDAF